MSRKFAEGNPQSQMTRFAVWAFWLILLAGFFSAPNYADPSDVCEAGYRTAGGGPPAVESGKIALGRELGSGGNGKVFYAQAIGIDGKPIPGVVLGAKTSKRGRVSEREFEILSEVHSEEIPGYGPAVQKVKIEDKDYITFPLAGDPAPPTVLEHVKAGVAGQPFKFEDFQPLANQIFDAVQDVHDKGIVHGDLKSSNLVFDGTKVSAIDYGLANRMAKPFPEFAGKKFGTSGFLGFEGLCGVEITAQRDVTATGATLLSLSRKGMSDAQRLYLALDTARTTKEQKQRFGEGKTNTEAFYTNVAKDWIAVYKDRLGRVEVVNRASSKDYHLGYSGYYLMNLVRAGKSARPVMEAIRKLDPELYKSICAKARTAKEWANDGLLDHPFGERFADATGLEKTDKCKQALAEFTAEFP